MGLDPVNNNISLLGTLGTLIIYTKSLACDMVQPPEPCLGATPGTMSRRNPRNMCVCLTSDQLC